MVLSYHDQITLMIDDFLHNDIEKIFNLINNDILQLTKLPQVKMDFIISYWVYHIHCTIFILDKIQWNDGIDAAI